MHQVSRRVATSSRQLQRVFADFGATHFRAELTAVRMQHAAELLHGNESIRLIAASVGYRDPAQSGCRLGVGERGAERSLSCRLRCPRTCGRDGVTAGRDHRPARDRITTPHEHRHSR
jgi:hypothetical protein